MAQLRETKRTLVNETGEAPEPMLKAVPQIELTQRDPYLVVTCGNTVEVYEMVWESRHGDTRRKLVVRPLTGKIPSEIESLVYRR